MPPPTPPTHPRLGNTNATRQKKHLLDDFHVYYQKSCKHHIKWSPVPLLIPG